ncbi:hypothetical protein SAMN05444172_9034 [Burkholderia sp. GAS332]|nr:hypothetical protein SAMN05444172_9034 [Burkholderia sp. GAS332]
MKALFLTPLKTLLLFALELAFIVSMGLIVATLVKGPRELSKCWGIDGDDDDEKPSVFFSWPAFIAAYAVMLLSALALYFLE